jgi:AAA family ATP:ADP antiporter
MIKAMGIPASLSAFPLFCCLALVLVAALPSTTTVAGVEVLRKVLGYSLVRPAREILFTVVSREEKYKAKVCIDTVVQRLGDALAAGAFQVLDVQLALGVVGVAAVGCPLCLLWAGIAIYLGRWHKKLAVGGLLGLPGGKAGAVLLPSKSQERLQH